MSTLEENLAGLLTGIPNCFADFIPREITDSRQFPATVYYIAVPGILHHQNGYIRKPLYRFDVWGESKDDVVTVSNQIITILDGVHASGISSIFEGERDMPDPETRLFRRILEFTMWGS